MNERGLGRNYASYDLSAYLSAARRLVAGEPLYPEIAASSFRLGQPDLYLYPPPVAALFVPFLILPFQVASALWGVFLTALAVVVALAIARDVAAPRRPLAVALVLAAFPLEWELAYGNVTLVTCALALVALRSVDRSLRGGTALALAMGLKLLAIPIAAFLALAGRRRTAILAAILLVVACLVTVPFLLRDWADWLALLAQLAGGPATQTNLLPGWFSVLPGRALSLAVAIGALIAAARLARTGTLAPARAAAIAFAVAPFVSAFVFFPYLLFALPLVVLLVLGDGPLWARAAGMAAWLLFEIQGLDQNAAFPSGALGVAIAVGTAFAAAATRTPSRTAGR